MKLQTLGCAVLGAGLITSASAKVQNPEYVQARKEMAQMVATEAAAAVTANGDPDSFGRYVKFIGLMTTGTINLADDCTPDPAFPPGPDDHCFVVNAAPASTSFTVTDAARLLIPAKASNSMLCHWQTPVVVYSFSNQTGVYRPNARFQLTPSYTIENAVLNDPTLINPLTGLPFGGSLSTNLPGIRHSRSLQPGEVQIERDTETRSCIDGLISKRSLMTTYGLTAAQAANFFKNDTIVTMNLQGTSTLVDFASIVVGTRFVGD
jgi:hypothetical protein